MFSEHQSERREAGKIGSPTSTAQQPASVTEWTIGFRNTHGYSAVTIHYLCPALGAIPDEKNRRATCFIPVMETRILL
jgi:hypothetical protein